MQNLLHLIFRERERERLLLSADAIEVDKNIFLKGFGIEFFSLIKSLFSLLRFFSQTRFQRKTFTPCTQS